MTFDIIVFFVSVSLLGMALVISIWVFLAARSVVFFGHRQVTTRLICEVMLLAIRQRAVVPDALDAALLSMSLRDRRRLRRAIGLMGAAEGSLIAPLAACKVLPSALVSDLQAAEAVSNEALACALSEHVSTGCADRNVASVITMVVQLLPYFILQYFLFSFISLFITPKFEQIFRELDLDIQGSFLLLVTASDWLNGSLPMPIVLFFCCGLLCFIGDAVIGTLRPGSSRYRRAVILLNATAARLSESELSHRLAKHWPRLAPALQEAGSRGSFAGLAAACGWPSVQSRTDLERAVARWRIRQSWYRILTVSCVRIVLPLVVAVPVALVAHGIFSALISVLEKLLV